MQSLVQALANRGVTDNLLVNEIQSYLSLDDLTDSWRFTTTLAYREVKKKVKKDIIPHSVWHNRYLARTEPCIMCGKRQKKEHLHVETRVVYSHLPDFIIERNYMLCDDCYEEYFSDEEGGLRFLCTRCSTAFLLTPDDWGKHRNYCHKCDTMYCYECKAAALVESRCPRLQHKCFCCFPCMDMIVRDDM